jgi:hypothetical protein
VIDARVKSWAGMIAQARSRPASSRINVLGGNAVAHILDRQQQAHLGEILRAVYQHVVKETLPEPLGNLLDALERPEVKSGRPPEALHSIPTTGTRGDPT